MSTQSATLAIKIISDASKAQAGFDQTTAKVSKMSQAGAIAGKVLAVGLLAAGAAAVKMTAAAAADEQAAAKLKQTLEAAAGATDSQVAAAERWITAQGKATGITDDELRPALAKLTVATHDVGKAQKLAGLAMDISAGSGKSLNAVTEALVKAQNGSVGGLSRLGVATKTANGETKSLNQIQKELAATYTGAAAKAADTVAGRQKILSTRMSELGETIGTMVLPVLERLTSVGLAATDWISKHTTLTLTLIGALGGLLAVVKLVSIATTLQSTATKIAGAAQWAWNAAMAANPIGLIVIAIAALVVGLVIAYKKSETFRNIVNAVGHAAAVAFGWVVDKLRVLAAWLKEKVPPAFQKIKAIAVPILKAITTPTRILIAVIVTLVKWIVGRWVAAFKIVKAVAVPILVRVAAGTKIIIGVVTTLVTWVKTRLVAGFNVWKTIAGNVFDRVKAGIGFVIDKVSALVTKVRDTLGSVFGGLRDKALGPINAIRDAFQSVYSWVQSAIDAVGRLIGAISNIHLPDINIPGLKVNPGALLGRAAMGGTVVNHITVNGALDPDAVARQIDTVLERRRRRLGVSVA